MTRRWRPGRWWPLDSRHAIDAFVVATAAVIGRAVILTVDAGDLGRLAQGIPSVAVHPLP
jgi:hypothetical protein